MSKKVDLAPLLLAWYAQNGRSFPWRFKGDARPDPYVIWVSEMMLQQTTIATGLPYFERWMKIFPDLKTLAQASLDDVLKAWQGLGYYTRAKKLHACAQQVLKMGGFPRDREALLQLPGIGPYTASAIAAFAFHQPTTVVDGNVVRVLSRLYGLTEVVTPEKIYPLAEKLTDKKHPADYASAIMDLGATLCRKTNPLCAQCPWQAYCVACKKGLTASIPCRQKVAKQVVRGAVCVIVNKKNQIFIQQADRKGLLGGLWELPWSKQATWRPMKARWHQCPQPVHHIFTHIDLTLDIYATKAEKVALPGRFISPTDVSKYAFSSLMKKVLSSIGSTPSSVFQSVAKD